MSFLQAIFIFLAIASPLLAEEESYSSRPYILHLDPHLASQSEGSALQKREMALFLAQLEAFYPENELYFLARDAESLYDLSQVMWSATHHKNRFHLLNVSSITMNSPYLREYLSQEGIHPASLSQKKIVLIDTGYSGTIITKIRELFPQYKDSIKSHLIQCHLSNHPQSKLFLAAATHPQAVAMMENLPHFTQASEKYKMIDGKWEPVSPVQHEGLKASATRNMQDLKYWGHSNLSYYQSLLSSMKHLTRIAEGYPANPNIIAQARALLGEKGLHAFVEDIYYVHKLNGLPLQAQFLQQELAPKVTPFQAIGGSFPAGISVQAPPGLQVQISISIGNCQSVVYKVGQ